jgi:hypothetical protein
LVVIVLLLVAFLAGVVLLSAAGMDSATERTGGVLGQEARALEYRLEALLSRARLLYAGPDGERGSGGDRIDFLADLDGEKVEGGEGRRTFSGPGGLDLSRMERVVIYSPESDRRRLVAEVYLYGETKPAASLLTSHLSPRAGSFEVKYFDADGRLIVPGGLHVTGEPPQAGRFEVNVALAAGSEEAETGFSVRPAGPVPLWRASLRE